MSQIIILRFQMNQLFVFTWILVECNLSYEFMCHNFDIISLRILGRCLYPLIYQFTERIKRKTSTAQISSSKLVHLKAINVHLPVH